MHRTNNRQSRSKSLSKSTKFPSHKSPPLASNSTQTSKPLNLSNPAPIQSRNIRQISIKRHFSTSPHHNLKFQPTALKPTPEQFTESLYGREPAPELGTEYLDLPDDTRDPILHKNLNQLLNSQYHFGYKPYAQVIAGTIDSKPTPLLTPHLYSTQELELKLQTEQTMENASARITASQLEQEKSMEFFQREAETFKATEEELEALKQRKAILRPVRSQMPKEIQELNQLLINEARRRQLDEHGNRQATTDSTIDPNLPQNHNDDSQQTVIIDGQSYTLSEIPDHQIVAQIVQITMDWNRSGSRTKPLSTADLSYSNKAKLEEGVPGYFSADKSRTGREFSYNKLLDPDQPQQPSQLNQTTGTDNNDNKPSAPSYHQNHRQSSKPQFDYEESMSMDLLQEQGEDEEPEPLVQEKPILPTLPFAIASPTNPLFNSIVKDSSPFKEIQVDKPIVSQNDKLPSTSTDLTNQLIHQDFLHNSIIRRRPRGKLTDLQIRDALVDVDRAHSMETILKHYDISLLSLFEESSNAQPISVASDVIGGFVPVFLKVKTDFDPSFVRMITLLHEQQRLNDATQQSQKSSTTTTTTFAGISNTFDSLPSTTSDQQEQSPERKHLEFLNRLITQDSNGYTTLHKDDILIPNFSDSVIEMMLNETLDKQLRAGEQYSTIHHHEGNQSSNAGNDDRIDQGMRDSMLREMLLFKGRTIGELHQMGCFNRSPYDDVQQQEYSPGVDNSTSDDGSQRGRYAFTDEMKHMHRISSQEEVEDRQQILYGEKGSQMKHHYNRRVDEQQQKRKNKLGLMSESGVTYLDTNAKKDGTSQYHVDESGSFYIGNSTPGSDKVLKSISRFAQLAVASSIIAKYGSLDSSYRKATGITMHKIDELLIDALDQGDVPIKNMSPQSRQEYLTKLKQDALQFPQLSFQAMSEQTHVPYMTTAVFEKVPSKFLGVWDYETAMKPQGLFESGFNHHHYHPLGPYHPMFLVTVGGRGFTKENSFVVEDFKLMLRGDIDERPQVIARRKAKWLKANPGQNYEHVNPFQFRPFVHPNKIQSQRREQEYIDPMGFDDEMNDTAEIDAEAERQQAHLQKLRHQQLLHRRNQIEQSNDQAHQIELNRIETKQILNDIPEISNLDDQEQLDSYFAQQGNTNHNHIPEPRVDYPGQSTKPVLPKTYPSIPNESNDPNEIVFNTLTMTEFHKTLEVNEHDIAQKSEQFFEDAELTHKANKEKAQIAYQSPDGDISHKFTLKHFVHNEFQQAKLEKHNQEFFGDFTNKPRAIHEAELDLKNTQSTIKFPTGDQSFLQRNKPNIFQAKSSHHHAAQNFQHELFGGPITVQHFLSSMVHTDEGYEIAKGIEKEHREFLGDKEYDETIKRSPVAKKAEMYKETLSSSSKM